MFNLTEADLNLSADSDEPRLNGNMSSLSPPVPLRPKAKQNIYFTSKTNSHTIRSNQDSWEMPPPLPPPRQKKDTSYENIPQPGHGWNKIKEANHKCHERYQPLRWVSPLLNERKYVSWFN